MHLPLRQLLVSTIIAIGFTPHGHSAEVLKLANSLSSSMVLQREMPVPVWGWGPPQNEVRVSFKGQSKIARSDADGRWQVVLDPLPADANPNTLEVVAAGQKVKAEDVLVGEVWLCAGPGIPRNMAALPNPKPEIEKARFPKVRILCPDTYTSIVPVADIPPPAAWISVAPESIGPYSVTWLFGRELHLAAGVPVGLILVNHDGAGAEWIGWTRDPDEKSQKNALQKLQEQLPGDIERAEEWLFQMQKRRSNDPVDLLVFPSHIPFNFYGAHPVFGEPYPIGYKRHISFNSGVFPMVPMALRGVFFQCEFDEKSAVSADDLKQVVASWREAWGRPAMPFVFSEPVLKQAKPAMVETALKAALTLPGVQNVTKPELFSEARGDGYWRSLAEVAGRVPKEEGVVLPPKTEWAKPSIVKAVAAPVRRKLEASHVFGSHMVLQCDQPVRVWGWSEPGETVSVSFGSKAVTTKSDETGQWQVGLGPFTATDSPETLEIKDSQNSLKFDDVVIGEVWVNSGQSNAGFVMSATLGFEEEQPKATNKAIRCFFNTKAADVLPQRRNMGEWRVLSPETVGKMSGMGYYFARSIYAAKRVPVGIVEANHGGSTIFSWTTETALASLPEFSALAATQKATRDEALLNLPLLENAVREWVAEARKNADLERPMLAFPIEASPVRPFYSAFLQNPVERRGCMFFNSMIKPMIGFGIRGVLWNQGEADGGKAAIYDRLMATMVEDWRRQWGLGFSFYYVQMPAKQSANDLLKMWEAQTRALSQIPNSGMIVCNDISEPGTRFEVHPRDKKNVGERLARLALVRTYGVKDMVDSSPMMQSVTRDKNRVSVEFAFVGKGLKTRDGKEPDSWEVAGADGKFVSANAEISGDRVTVSAPGVDAPGWVRLGWRSDSNCNLVNSEGLPALPFEASLLK